MIRKAKSSGVRGKHRRKQPPYPSMAHGPRPAERLTLLLEQADERGIKPLTEADLDAMADVWPEDESVDDFLSWRRESRERIS